MAEDTRLLAERKELIEALGILLEESASFTKERCGGSESYGKGTDGERLARAVLKCVRGATEREELELKQQMLDFAHDIRNMALLDAIGFSENLFDLRMCVKQAHGPGSQMFKNHFTEVVNG